jgi:magnesium chelatase subunit I
MPVSSLVQLIEQASAKPILDAVIPEDRGIAEQFPYPFMALVGQSEMKTALVLTLINPAVNGVLLIGPRGTGKTTAVRSLTDLLPLIPRSLCPYGCTEEDIENEGMDGVCDNCAKKFGLGEPLTRLEPVAIVELPLNARLEDVVGGLDERSAARQRTMLQRGILARADRNLLYVDEVNLLADDIIDAILDAAAQGLYTLKRGPLSATFRARFALIGSMNPEEGKLRPQMMDRFGLRLTVRGLSDPNERLEAYRLVRAYLTNARATAAAFADQTLAARDDIQTARNNLPKVTLSSAAEKAGLALVQKMKIDSLRAEITMFEAARAYAAADSRFEATAADVKAVAPMALRLRRSKFMEDYFTSQQTEEAEIKQVIDSVIPE